MYLQCSGIAIGSFMITTNERAWRLADLTDDQFLIVAVRKLWGRQWDYKIPESEVRRFHDAVGHGDIVSVQRLEEDGGFVVLAKLAAVR